MKTSTVVLSSILAAGASGVTARPFFGNPADLSIANLLGRSTDTVSKNVKTNDHAAHAKVDTNKSAMELTGDSHVKAKGNEKVKVKVKGPMCIDVTVNGILTQDCGKDAQKTIADGKYCHSHDDWLALQVKYNAILQENHKLQGYITGYKHKIVDYEHQISVFEHAEHSDGKHLVKGLAARAAHNENRHSSSSSDVHVTHDDKHSKQSSSAREDGHHTDKHSSSSSSANHYEIDHHQEHDSSSHHYSGSEPAKPAGKPSQPSKDTGKPKPAPPRKEPQPGNKNGQHHDGSPKTGSDQHEEKGGYKTGKDLKIELKAEGKIIEHDIKQGKQDLHHDYYKGQQDFRQGKTGKVLEKDGKAIQQDMKAASSHFDSEYHRDAQHFDSEYGRDSTSFDSSMHKGDQDFDSESHRDGKMLDSALQRGDKGLDRELHQAGKNVVNLDLQGLGKELKQDGDNLDKGLHSEGKQMDKEMHRDGKTFDSQASYDGKTFDTEAHRDSQNFDSEMHRDGKQFEESKQKGKEEIGLEQILRRGPDYKYDSSYSASFHDDAHHDYSHHSSGSDVDDDLHHDGKKVDYTTHRDGKAFDKELHRDGKGVDREAHRDGKALDSGIHRDGKTIDKDAHQLGSYKYDEQEMKEGASQLGKDVKTVEDHLYLNKIGQQGHGLFTDAGKDGKKIGGDLKGSSTIHDAHNDIHDDDKTVESGKVYKGADNGLDKVLDKVL